MDTRHRPHLRDTTEELAEGRTAVAPAHLAPLPGTDPTEFADVAGGLSAGRFEAVGRTEAFAALAEEGAGTAAADGEEAGKKAPGPWVEGCQPVLLEAGQGSSWVDLRRREEKDRRTWSDGPEGIVEADNSSAAGLW